MVDFGTSTTGSGNQPVTNPSPVQNPTPQPQQTPTPQPEPQTEPVESTPEATPQPEPVSEVESPDVVPEETQPTPTPQPEPEPEPEKPQINQNAMMGPQTGAGGGSQGNDANASGDKGQTDGSQSDNYSGTVGGGNGNGLDVRGWEWAQQPPRPSDISATSGYVKFRIKGDQYGNITEVEAVESTLSASDERKLRNAIFSGKLRPDGGGISPNGGVGYFTWRIKTSG